MDIVSKAALDEPEAHLAPNETVLREVRNLVDVCGVF